ncbi:MAG: hypothetical protein JXA82_11640 [Sedimentisphaerales bacterium]|nr:hypothetical protein [Sedimentisphaerales bacterium]
MKTHVFLLTVLICYYSFTLAQSVSVENPSLEQAFFRIQVVDEETGRGVPLVKLETTNLLSYITDSQGIVALYEPGLMDQRVYFHISSHGYEYPKDGFGYRGKAFAVQPGGSETVQIKRLNIAERLYRVTGQGIYRDSVIVGESIPLKKPVINGLVMGQDSVQTCIYQGRLYWFWGDTGRPSYPLGQFAMSGARSLLPQQGGLDPAVGVDLQYFTDKDGFSRKMFPLSETGMVWMEGPFTVKDPSGRIRMVAKYSRMKSLGEAVESGLGIFNDQTETFERLVHGGPDFFPYHGTGHPVSVLVGNVPYTYFATAFPLSVRMRIRTVWEDVTNVENYEVYTAPDTAGRQSGSGYRWISVKDLIGNKNRSRRDWIKALRKEKEQDAMLYDIDSGETVFPHGGSVYWNHYRNKWIMITVQQGGTSSYLGEVWYAEADTPLGPWRYARQVATHETYSFYNPKQHPYFDQEDGRWIYFEGTYSHTFSGTKQEATPRYDYNQIMYRLDLKDRRLSLPAPVYEVSMPDGQTEYMFGSDIRRKKAMSMVKGIAFCAVGPDRMYDDLIPIYPYTNGKETRLEKTRSTPSDRPLFYGLSSLPAEEKQHSIVVGLYEWTNKSGMRRYSTQTETSRGWKKNPVAVCYVWKNPSQIVLVDWDAVAICSGD